MSIVPPTRIVWAESSISTQRLTGKYRLMPYGQKPPEGMEHWMPLDTSTAIMLMNGTKPWNSYAKVGDRVAEVPQDVDLRFLSHISHKVWPEIANIDHKWTGLPYIPLDIPIIEPDDWDLFWKLWNEKQADITRGLNETQYWKGLCCWLNPLIDHTKFNFNNTVIDDWSMYFPKMFKQIHDSLPFYSVEKIVLWSNINEVNPHIDPDVVIYPWPDSLRIMLWNTNDHPTFWMSHWPARDEKFNPPIIETRSKGSYGIKADRVPMEKRMYIDLPKETNTFVFNNGAYLHGADLAKPKIIMAVKGRPKIYEWISTLEKSYQKYGDNIKKCPR